uniref:Uncharacterized protein n=1 Tax=Strigamia maritima TaxID=126957 RepID=T1IWU3_STRMM
MESCHNRMLYICVLIFILFLEYGAALRCYICNSTQTACGVEFDAKKTDLYVHECGQHIHDPVCRKEMHIPNGNSEKADHRQVMVQRTCSGHSPYKRHCYEIESASAGHTLKIKGSSILCWTCNSYFDPRCADPFDNTSYPITDCSQQSLPHLHFPSTMCRKIKQKVDGRWRFIRSCAWLGEAGIGGDERYCLLRTGTWDIHVEYCNCNAKDGCNNSIKTQINYVLMFTLLLSSFILRNCIFKIILSIKIAENYFSRAMLPSMPSEAINF